MHGFSSGLAGLLAASLLALAACSAEERSAAAPSDAEPAAIAAAAATQAAVATFPASLPVIGDGYPQSGAPCRRLGESAATADWLDDSAVLVGCPTREDAGALGGRMVGVIDGISLVSVPMGDANAGMTSTPAMAPPVKVAKPAAPRDFIRSKGGLEEKCHQRLAREVGARVIGTNRIEESEAAIAIYVNMQGAQAPWRCLGYKDGTIGEVMYTGSEGVL
jgi:hypothetical protein